MVPGTLPKNSYETNSIKIAKEKKNGSAVSEVLWFTQTHIHTHIHLITLIKGYTEKIADNQPFPFPINISEEILG